MGISPPTLLLHLFIRIAVTQEKILSHHAILRSAKIILIPTFPGLLCTLSRPIMKETQLNYPSVNDELFHSRFHGYYDLRCCDEASLRGDGWW